MDKKGRILVICATILVVSFLGTASATNWSVDGSGGGDFTGIQDAINNAYMGDTILVHSGIYYEHVYVNKSVTLIGIGYPVVDANGSGSAITLNADGITLEGFNATNSGSLWDGAGINVISSNNTITGNNVRNNSEGISLDSSSNNSITGNNLYNNEYGISLADSNNNTITGNNVSNNEYGGIYLADSSNNNTITGNTFVNNGLRVSNSYQNTVEGNIVNDKPLVYLEDASDYTVKDAGQVILVNCDNITVENGELSNTDVGIELWKTKNSRISNNKVSNNNCGSISLSGSSNNSITGNNASNNNGDGISLSDSSNNTITGNNASNNSNVGIYLSGDSSNNTVTDNNVCNNSNVGIWLSSLRLFPFNNTITGNNVRNNYGGIYLSRSSNNSITGNNVSDNYDDGISLDTSSSNNTISGNTFVNDGLSVDDSYQNTVEDNIVNGKPLVYLEDASDYTVEDAGQVILVNCTNITVEDLDLSNTSVGVELWKTEDSKVLNNTVSNNGNGISLWNSCNNTITGNNVNNNSIGGISLWNSCNNNTITGNTFVNCGLFVLEHYQNTVEDNTVNGKPLVYLVDASEYTVEDAGQVILVNCTSITVDNLELSNTSVGIELWKTEDSKVLNNTISDNSNTGIILSSSSNNTITGNNVSNNGNDGIYLSRSSNNSICLNNFINNTVNVESYASTNIWNSPEEITYTYDGTTYESYLGNYWADYKGTDADGIGNRPYSIDPEKEECDVYPLMKPFENYISSESDTEVAATSNMETIAKTFVNLPNECERTQHKQKVKYS